MPSEYIIAADYSLFGLPSGTTQMQVYAASAQIDAYLQRPEGCVYSTVNNLPAIMDVTQSPIVETQTSNRGRLQLSNTPVVAVLKIEQRINGSWVEVSGSYSFDKNGLMYTEQLSFSQNSLRVTYIAGWTYSTLPIAIKNAVASLIKFAVGENMSSNIKRFRAGDTEIERFDDVPLDGDTRALLAPYRRTFA